MSIEVREFEFPQARVVPAKPRTLAEEIVDVITGIETFLLHAHEHGSVLAGPELMWVHGIRDGLVAVLAWLPTLERQR